MICFLKKHKYDIILVGAILIIALIVLLVFVSNRTQGAYAVIVIDGKETAVYPLNQDATVPINNGNDTYNILVIKDESAKILEASCPDKLCVNQGSIKYSGESLVCLPNKTIVKIVSDEYSDIDFG